MLMRLGIIGSLALLIGCAVVVIEPETDEAASSGEPSGSTSASSGGGGASSSTGAGGTGGCPDDWTHILGGTGANWLRRQAVAPDGSVAVTVDSTADLTVDGVSVGFDEGGLVVVKFGPGGDFEWARRLGQSTQLPAMPVAFDQDGNLLVGGVGYGPIDFGGVVANNDGPVGYVVKYSAEGVPLWVQSWSVSNESGGLANMALDGDGNVFFQGAPGYGQDILEWGSLTAEGEMVVGKILADGSPAWIRGFDGVLVETRGLATTPEGHVVIGQSLAGTGTFGDVELSTVANFDALSFEMDPDGVVLDARQFGDDHLQRSSGFVIGPTGTRALIGTTWGVVDFGTGPVSGPDANDVFLAGFDANGESSWTKTAPNAYAPSVMNATSDGGVALVVTSDLAAAFGCGESEPGFVLAQVDASGMCHVGERITHCSEDPDCEMFLGGVDVSPERNVVSGHFYGGAVLRDQVVTADIWDGFVTSKGTCAAP